MKVRDVMTKNVAFCRPENNLAEVTELMWKHRCGAVPIVVESGRVVGIITDRDICMALGTRNLKASNLTAADVSLPKYFACGPFEDIHDALQTMASQEVRRLPVVDADGKLVGILSIDDVVLFARAGSTINFGEVIRTLKAICEYRPHDREALIETAANAAN
jgi:CBS domain-containing protein